MTPASEIMQHLTPQPMRSLTGNLTRRGTRCNSCNWNFLVPLRTGLFPRRERVCINDLFGLIPGKSFRYFLAGVASQRALTTPPAWCSTPGIPGNRTYPPTACRKWSGHLAIFRRSTWSTVPMNHGPAHTYRTVSSCSNFFGLLADATGGLIHCKHSPPMWLASTPALEPKPVLSIRGASATRWGGDTNRGYANQGDLVVAQNAVEGMQQALLAGTRIDSIGIEGHLGP